MQIALESIIIVILLVCLVFLCIKSKKKSHVFVLSLIYLGINIAFKVLSLLLWTYIDSEFMEVYTLISATVVCVNYLVLLLIIIYVLRNKKEFVLNKTKTE